MPTEVTDPTIIEELEGGSASPADTEKPAPLHSGRDAGLYGSLVEGFSGDEAKTIRFLASELYPDEAPNQAIKRFGKKDGVIFHRADDGNLYEALPSGAMPRIAGAVGRSIPVATGTAAGLATSPLSATGVGFPVSLAATAGAAAGGEAIRQGIGNVLMGEEGLSPGPVVEQGMMGASGQAIGAGLGTIATRGAVRDIGRLDPAKTQQAYDEAGRVGIPITPAEATGLPTLAAQQKRLTNITPTADKMREFLTARDKTIVQRWGEFLDTISMHSDAERVGKLARESARSVLSDMRSTLKAQAKPLYDAAYAKPVPYTTELETLLKRPVMQKALGKARELSANEGIQSKQFFAKQNPDGTWAVTRVPDMREWDYIKRGLDEIQGSSEAMNQSTGWRQQLRADRCRH